MNRVIESKGLDLDLMEKIMDNYSSVLQKKKTVIEKKKKQKVQTSSSETSETETGEKALKPRKALTFLGHQRKRLLSTTEVENKKLITKGASVITENTETLVSDITDNLALDTSPGGKSTFDRVRP